MIYFLFLLHEGLFKSSFGPPWLWENSLLRALRLFLLTLEEGAGDDSNGDEEDGDDVSPRRNCFQSFEANLSKQSWPPRPTWINNR